MGDIMLSEDTQLRDRLSKEFSNTVATSGSIAESLCAEGFCAGWDAARSNDGERQALFAELIGQEHRLGTQLEILEMRCEKLQAEVARLHNETVKIEDGARRDRLAIIAERDQATTLANGWREVVKLALGDEATAKIEQVISEFTKGE